MNKKIMAVALVSLSFGATAFEGESGVNDRQYNFAEVGIGSSAYDGMDGGLLFKARMEREFVDQTFVKDAQLFWGIDFQSESSSLSQTAYAGTAWETTVSSELTANSFGGKVGYRLPVQEKLDAVFTAGLQYVLASAEVCSNSSCADGSDSDLGITLTAEGRYQINEDFDAQAGIGINTAADSAMMLGGQVNYYLNEQFAVGGGLWFSSDVTQFAVLGRYNF